MSEQPYQQVEQELRRVRRRLFAQLLAQSLLKGWALALAAVTLWFLLRPFTLANHGEALRWTVPAVLLILGTLGALLLAWARRPSLVASSLALDEKFALQERVTTLATLTPEQLQTPAGQALLRDVHAHLADLDVASRFPLRVSGQSYLLPAVACALALGAFVLDPFLCDLKFSTWSDSNDIAKNNNTKQLQDQLEKLTKNVAQRNQDNLGKSAKLKELEKELEKVLQQPLDTRSEEKIRDRIAELNKLDEKMKEQWKNRVDKLDQLKSRLEKLDLDRKAPLKEGPAKDIEDALKKGDFQKAAELVEKLTKDLKNEPLTKEQQKDLAEQFEQLQQKLQRLVDDDELKQQLKQAAKDGKLDKEELQRELERMQDLQDLADLLKDLGKADGKQLQGKLEKIRARLQKLDGNEDELNDLLRDREELDAARQLLLAQLQAQGNLPGNGMNGQGPGGGKRPSNPRDPDSKIAQEHAKTQADPKGAQRLMGFTKGGSFKTVGAKSVQGAFQQAAQEAPEALERDPNIPREKRDSVRGYFQKLSKE